MANQKLALHGAGEGIIAVNDDWRESSTAQELAALGFAPADDREAALKLRLSGGSYTAVVRGANGTTGVGLVEVYDVDDSSAELANISTRGFVQLGDEVMIGGFILGSGDDGRVLIRALGPSLVAVGVARSLPDPQLELHDAQGALVTANNDWPAATNAEDIRATNIPPPDERGSAISDHAAGRGLHGHRARPVWRHRGGAGGGVSVAVRSGRRCNAAHGRRARVIDQTRTTSSPAVFDGLEFVTARGTRSETKKLLPQRASKR